MDAQREHIRYNYVSPKSASFNSFIKAWSEGETIFRSLDGSISYHRVIDTTLWDEKLDLSDVDMDATQHALGTSYLRRLIHTRGRLP